MTTSTAPDYRSSEQSFFTAVRWKRAIQVGLAVGAVTCLLNRGIPWVGSGAINPAIMGREVVSETEVIPIFSFSVIALHLIVSMLYALIIAPIVHGFKPWTAGAVGACVGLVLYFINYALSVMVMETVITQREWPAIVLHVVFGIVVAEAYKGFVREAPIEGSSDSEVF